MAVKDGSLLHHLERLNKIIGIKIFNNVFEDFKSIVNNQKNSHNYNDEV